ncbi:MAG: tRNA (guanosine(37)-N1)-methyltransferase TrmD [Armatimonadetes bacterium]|nr:tRNA (guanosine(37)-N1)-methyltransferase TrmD [Armatimonadota bacterium]
MKKIAFVTLFPDWIRSSLDHSILARAEASDLVEFSVVNPRNFCYDPHKKVDDVPYGGHPGMLIKAEPVALAIESLSSWRLTVGSLQNGPPKTDQPDTSLEREVGEERTGRVDTSSPSEQPTVGSQLKNQPVSDQPNSADPKLQIPNSTAIVITEPSGIPFTQKHAEELAEFDQIIFVCGHYEGIDHRIEETFATHVFSIGDYVLTNGEMPALVMADAVVRLIPGVLGNENSLDEESFQNNLLGAPNYTRPEVWRGIPIPDVLKSGNHGAIDKWRQQQAEERTRTRRPDLLEG